MIHQRTVCLIMVLLSLTCLIFSQVYGQLPVVRIEIVADGPWEGSDEIRNLFQQEILELTRGEFDVRFEAEKLVRADWTAGGVKEAVDQLLTDRDVDMILALGAIATNE